MKLSIIILNWNTRDLLKQAIESIYQATSGFDFEIIVSDNGSADGSVEMVKDFFPQTVLLDNKANLGFAKGNNVAMKIAKGDYLMLLNSDVIVLDGAINKLVEYLDTHPDVYLAGPRLLNKDGSFQDSCRRRLPNPWNSFVYLFGLSFLFGKKDGYHQKHEGSEKEIGEAGAISGAAMIFRRQVYEAIGGLDESFFMYGEDLDFCKRVSDKFGKIGYVGTAAITHLYGQSSKKRKVGSIINFYDAMWFYYRKHFYAGSSPIFNGLVFTGIRLKLLLALLRNTFKAKA